MKKSDVARRVRKLGVAALTAVVLGVAAPAAADAEPADRVGRPSPTKPTVVLVHGAWADASSFAPVTAGLQHEGYTVLSAPNPLRGLSADAAYVAAFVNQRTTGPVILVGHSYGGAVITNAAQSIPNVKALVYIDAHALAEGESMLDVTAAQPGSALGVADPSTVFDFAQYPGAPEGDVDTYIKPDLFAGFFAAKLPKAVTATLAVSQSPVTLSALSEKSGAPAWARIPSFFFIGSEDKILPPAEQEFMAKRAHGYVERGRTDHLAMLEAPSTIVKLVDRAAK
jgi:pimeloyl-ACP methyl ester carboxylesterase